MVYKKHPEVSKVKDGIGFLIASYAITLIKMHKLLIPYFQKVLLL